MWQVESGRVGDVCIMHECCAGAHFGLNVLAVLHSLCACIGVIVRVSWLASADMSRYTDGVGDVVGGFNWCFRGGAHDSKAVAETQCA